MSDSYSTTPTGGGQSPSAPTHLKYIFDPNRCIVFDAEVYPGRWCVGFLFPGREKSLCVDGDRAQLAEILDKIARAGRTLVGYNSQDYDEPVLRAILAGEGAFQISRALIAYDGPGLPPELRDRAACWPRIEADTIDLASRTKSGGRFPGLKTVAANLGCKHLQELPYDPTKPVTDAEWEHVKAYNKKDLDATRLVLEHFAPELEALATLSNRYDLDLRSVHQAAIAGQVLCAAYRDRYGRDPSKVAPPASVRYQPPSPVVRPRNEVAAGWFDRLCSEEFPLVVPKGGSNPVPTVPEPSGMIVIGGIELNVGSGGLHSVDRPALYRADAEHEIYETDVASFYPSQHADFVGTRTHENGGSLGVG
jgi:hypothetical protein